MTVKNNEFVGERAQLYKTVLQRFPKARQEEVDFNMSLFKPQKEEKILEIGCGSGLYTTVLAGKAAEVIATDPSEEQLKHIPVGDYSNIRIIKTGAHQLLENEELIREKNSFDAIWSLGAFHHCLNKSQAFNSFFQLLKSNGRLFLCDVFSGSGFARYFDTEVAKYSITGHEVSFLTEEFFSSLCFLFGFKKPKFSHIDYHWNFKTVEEMSLFMSGLHGLSNISHENILKGLETFLTVEQKSDHVVLHVPLTIFETYKK